MEKAEACQKAHDDAVASIPKMLEADGLPRSAYRTVIKECLSATRSISCLSGKEADGGTVDFVDVPDYRVRLEAGKVLIALYGDNAPDKKEISIEGSLMAAVAAHLGNECENTSKT